MHKSTTDTPRGIVAPMHVVRNKKKLIARVRRVRGQVEAVERALLEDEGCEAVVRTIVAARGAISALAAEVLCEHIEEHLGARRVPADERAAAAAELAQILRRFLG